MKFFRLFTVRILLIPSAFLIRIKDERKMKRIFRDCPPIFYHWIEGWFRETLKVSAKATK